MRYWIVKGKASENYDFDDLFTDNTWTWGTRRPPKNSWAEGDRIFQWSSSPDKCVIALGEITALFEEPDEDGNYLFDITYLTDVFEQKVYSNVLKEHPVVSHASFLKSGPVQTVLSLTQEQAQELYKIVVAHNQCVESVWPDLIEKQTTYQEIKLAEEITETGNLREGAVRQVLVNAYERKPEARAICVAHYGARCVICNFDFASVYGEIGKGYIHVHHLQPLSSIGEEYEVNPITDLRPVCPNCHAMIHQRIPPYKIEELQLMIKRMK